VRDKLSNGLAKALGINENSAEMAWIFGWEFTNLGLYSVLTDLTLHHYAIFNR
jgi:hypothetical protein